MPGDVVRRLIAGKDTQRGYCRDIVMTAALQIVGTNHVIPCVASERLQPLEEFTPDLAVCLDSWVGTSKVSSTSAERIACCLCANMSFFDFRYDCFRFGILSLFKVIKQVLSG